MSRLRLWLPRFSASDWIATVALLIALPATIDLLVRWTTAPSIEIVPPSYVEFRANIPSQAKQENGILLAHPDGERAIDAAQSMAHHLHAVIPVTFRNTGYEGSEVSVLEERLVVTSTVDRSVEFVFRAQFNTEIVPADSIHWWWGNLKPWLPIVIDGGESRSSEAIFRAQSCPSDCRWDTFLHHLENHTGAFDIRLEVSLLTGDMFSSESCRLDPTGILTSHSGEPPDRKRFYRREASCVILEAGR